MISSKKYDFPKIVGILNVTPDSFSDGGKFSEVNEAVKRCSELIEDGADIIDIGGESTRPGSDSVDTETELNRVIPVIKEIKKIFHDARVSVDTTKYEVAKAALDLGADFINDISGLRFDVRLAKLANEYQVPIIIMHSRENPKTMQKAPAYTDLWSELNEELDNSIQLAKMNGVDKIIIDPGIGFAKSYDNNLEILRNFGMLSVHNLPILLGISRKSFIGKMFGDPKPDNRDISTALIHTIMLRFKIDYIRVHNVGLANQIKILYKELV